MDFFSFSKLFETLLTGGNFFVILLVVGLLLTQTPLKRLGRRITFATAVFALILFLLPIGSWSMAPLENRFARQGLPEHVDGILVLSGGENPALFQRRGTAATIFSEGRLVEVAALSRKYPQARIVFSGFEADVARAAFVQIGLDTNRIVFEKRARSTWETLVFSQDLVHPLSGETWLLITHAVSMPRAIGVARRVGWQMLAWPVDYRTGAGESFLSLDFADNLVGSMVAAHEWIGLAAYRITGRSTALFPAPLALAPDKH
jgi:uncharacterized SAM-binding protein YcdF (DUF218 family)